MYTQSFKFHSSNGTIYCFYQDRVFISCMDKECSQELCSNRCNFKIMSRVVEEDIFAKFLRKDPAEKKVIANSIAHSHPHHLSGSSIRGHRPAAPGLTPAMLQRNPAVRRKMMAISNALDTCSQRSTSTSSCCTSPVPHMSERYFDALEVCTLECKDVKEKLSSSQYQDLLDLRDRRDRVLAQGLELAAARKRKAASCEREETAAQEEESDDDGGGGGHPLLLQPEKINVRAIARVPFR